MVRACLRVLKHHGVIALVDMFMYSNRYEFTDKATAMLAGKEPKLLQEALDFVMKRPGLNMTQGLTSVAQIFGGGGGSGSESSHPIQVGSPYQHTPSSSYPPRTMNLLGGSQRSSNFRYAMMAAQSLEKESSIGTRREDQPRLKSALAELYCACNRNISFGDLWVSLTTELPTSLVLPNLHKMQGTKPSTTNNQRHSSTRKNSITDDFVESDQFRDQLDSLALSPLETIQLDALRKPSGERAIDWNEFFKRFDHRRFFSFGVVHGLLVRVHNYPYFPGIFPEMKTSLNGALIQSDSKQNLKNEFIEEKSYMLARSIASLMDGTRCDDELVCLFEKPFNQLAELVEKFGVKKIVSVFAPAPDL
jgi:hypothetical protein